MLSKAEEFRLRYSLLSEKRILDDLIDEIEEWIVLNPAENDVGRLREVRLRLESRRSLIKAEMLAVKNQQSSIFKPPSQEQIQKIKDLMDKVEEMVMNNMAASAILELGTEVLKEIQKIRKAAA